MTMPELGVSVLFDPEVEKCWPPNPHSDEPEWPDGDCACPSLDCKHHDGESNCELLTDCPWLELFDD